MERTKVLPLQIQGPDRDPSHQLVDKDSHLDEEVGGREFVVDMAPMLPSSKEKTRHLVWMEAVTTWSPKPTMIRLSCRRQ